jgi:hypothetical protein
MKSLSFYVLLEKGTEEKRKGRREEKVEMRGKWTPNIDKYYSQQTLGKTKKVKTLNDKITVRKVGLKP